MAVDAGSPKSTVTTAVPSLTVTASSSVPNAADAGRDAGQPYDPKYKCPTGQTHFYMEGDFCRRKCMSTSDCGKKERCSSMAYPYIMEGLPAGSSRFCEGF